MTPPAIRKDPDKPEPSPGFLKRLENLTTEAAAKALDMPHKSKAAIRVNRTPEQEAQLREIEMHAVAEFEGDLTQLEAALGMLRMGHHFGWRVLYLIHTKQTIRNYEQILGDDVKIRDIFDPTGPSSYRSFGLNLAQRFSNFWKVAGGTIKIPKRREAA
ncbi:MAG: hypothetical protein IH604_00440 [Burkholderiales bacterium]|nr:hypothetical protein [Burkholderiales bacterium]